MLFFFPEPLLLPCPFCGSNDLNTSHINEICCKNCDGCVYVGDCGELTHSYAIDAWNRRPSDNKKGS